MIKKYIVTSEAWLQRLVQLAPEIGTFQFDVETKSPEVHIEPPIVGIQLGWKRGEDDFALYIPVGHETCTHYEYNVSNKSLLPVYDKIPGQLPLESVIRCLQCILGNGSLSVIGHNLKYDLKRFIHTAKVMGIDPTVRCKIIDTMILSNFLDRENDKLKDTVFREFGEKLGDFLSICPTPEKCSEVSIKDMAEYAWEDVIWPGKLYEHFLAEMQLRYPRKVKLIQQLEGTIVSCLAHMENVGVKLDLPLLEELALDFEAQRDAHDVELRKLVPADINWNSTQQVSKLMFDDLGWWDAEKLAKSLKPMGVEFIRGGSGAFSTAETILQDLLYYEAGTEEGMAVIRLILNRKEVEKLLNTFVRKLPTMVDDDHRVHTTIWHLGARTSRFSSSDPNLQQIPARTENGARIRRAFIAEEGWKLVGADYSQIEMRILAHYSGDELLTKVFIEGEDPHSATARLMGIDRATSKTLNYAVLYGSGATNIARTLRIGRAKAQRYKDQFYSTYAGLVPYQEKCVNIVRKNQEISSLFGHTRSFRKEISDGKYWKNSACNTPIQGTAGAIVKIAMRDIYNFLVEHNLLYTKVNMVLQIHDELLFEVREDYAEEFKLVVIDKMENAAKLNVPLTVSAGIGSSWGDVH